MNKIKSLRFPVKGVGGFNLIFSEIVVIVATVFLAIVPVVSDVEVSVSVSKYQVSLSQGFVVVKVLGCAVEIQVRLLVSLHFC
jgi:hypothetical protein